MIACCAKSIWMDGNIQGSDPTYNGHSIGRWEGDTLVIDTIGIKETTWVDHVGLPHSDALHLVERIRRVDHDHLEDDSRSTIRRRIRRLGPRSKDTF